MDIRVRVWDVLSQRERRALTGKRDFASAEFRAIRRRARWIIERVRRDGDYALRYFSKKYNGYALPRAGGESFRRALMVEPEERRNAVRQVEPAVRAALDTAIANARLIQRASTAQTAGAQMADAQTAGAHEPDKNISPANTDISGVSVRHRWLPIPSAGLYVPRGKGSFPSMMVMLGVPAQIAAVPRVIVMTPPTAEGGIDPATLYVADAVGVEQIYKLGGAHGIAAMALGTESVPAVDKIFGPGSAYVTIARWLLSGVVDCGMLAGPSEAMIIADEHADPRSTALDLMIEAEHGSDSAAFLITASDALIAAVRRIVGEELARIPAPRRGYIAAVLGNYGGIIKSRDIEQALAIANAFAPEHLKIDTARPERLAADITSAGEILLGRHSAFSIANYLTGANSILPTNRNARTWSAISAADFCTRRAEIAVSAAGFAALAPHTAALADYEGFPAHAHAVRARELHRPDARK